MLGASALSALERDVGETRANRNSNNLSPRLVGERRRFTGLPKVKVVCWGEGAVGKDKGDERELDKKEGVGGWGLAWK